MENNESLNPEPIISTGPTPEEVKVEEPKTEGSKIEEPKEKKLKTGIIFGCLFVLATAAAGVFAYLYFTKPEETTAGTNCPKCATCPTCEKCQECQSLSGIIKNLAWDESKIIRKSSGSEAPDFDYNFSPAISSYGASSILSDDGKSLTITVSMPHTSDGSIDYNAVVGEHIIKFDQRVIDFALGGFGEVYLPTELIFVMEDGTVQYASIYDMLKNNRFEVSNTIQGLKNIIRIYPSMSRTHTTEKGFAATDMTMLVQDIDGNIYDLMGYIYN